MITVLGARGFIGSHIVSILGSQGIEHFAPARTENLAGKGLGHIIYCIGLTSDFRRFPKETVQAHVCNLLEIVGTYEYESLLYLSSTRLYKSEDNLAEEDDPLLINPLDPNDLYNLSKAMGEAIVLSVARNGKVARLSNIYGDDLTSENFLSSLIKDAVKSNRVMLRTSLRSEKDYLRVDKVADALIGIATSGHERIYNVASGRNVTHLELVSKLMELTGCTIEVEPDALDLKFPRISIMRLEEEFQFTPSDVVQDLSSVISSYRSITEGAK